jgi:hypothetical protein
MSLPCMPFYINSKKLLIERWDMLNALWVVLLGMAALFIVQAILFLFMILLKKFVPAEKTHGEKG